jgi:hypothetical protein
MRRQYSTAPAAPALEHALADGGDREFGEEDDREDGDADGRAAARHWKTLIAASSTGPMPPAPTSQSTAESRRLMFQRRSTMESLVFIRKLSPEQWKRGGIHATRDRVTVDSLVVDPLRRALEGRA